MGRLLCLVGVAALLAACSAGPSGPTAGSQATPPAAATSASNPPAQTTPGATQPTGAPQPNSGDNEALARALVPPGATEISGYPVGNNYTLNLTSTQSLEQLSAFWAQAIPAAGMQLTGEYNNGAGSLVVAFTNPDGGITAATDTSTGNAIINISVGTVE